MTPTDHDDHAPTRRRTRIALPLLAALLAVGLLPEGVATGQADRKYTVITGTGRTLYKIAIAPVIDRGGAGYQAKEATGVLTRDLTLCGMFKVLNPRGFLANLKKEGVSIDPGPWMSVGAQGVIKARTQRLSAGRYSIDFFLYDTTRGAKPVLAKSYKSKGKSVRRLAHRFGNEVVRYFTGEAGVFHTKIAFSAGSGRSRRSQIYVMDYDGHGAHRVSRSGPQNVLPAWSPRGGLVWTGFLWRNPDLYARKGSRAFRLSKRPGLNTGAAFSPDGSKIALTLSKDGNAELYLISAGSGAVIRRLTRSPAIDTSPSWSPDGSRIAFVSNRGGSPQIYVMSASGGGVKRLTFKGSYNQEPAWCPRKATPLVAFTSRDGGRFDIFTVNIKTGEVKRLTQGQGSNKSPTWSPDGRLLAYSSSRGGLWLMDSDGLNQHRIYRGGGKTPAWSH